MENRGEGSGGVWTVKGCATLNRITSHHIISLALYLVFLSLSHSHSEPCSHNTSNVVTHCKPALGKGKRERKWESKKSKRDAAR